MKTTAMKTTVTADAAMGNAAAKTAARQSVLAVYKGEKLKYRHTVTGKLWFLLPLLNLALAFGLSVTYGVCNSYNWWYIGILPGFFTLFCCMAGEKEKRQKDQASLLTAIDLKKAWDAKVLIAMKNIALANIALVISVFAAGKAVLILTRQEQVIQVSIAQGAAAAVLMTVISFWQIPFCLWMDRKVGMFPALAVNMALNTSGILTAVYSFWLCNPWGILPRLLCPVLGILPNNLPARPGSATYTPQITDSGCILPGVLVSLALFIILWFLTRRWYERKGAVAR